MQKIINEPIDLRDRALDFSKELVRFCKSIDNNQITRPVISQLLRSSTSIGANFIEAKDSGSKKDFRHKVLLSKKEASETIYWLRICEEFGPNERLSRLQKECQEIILILQKIISTLSH